MGLVNAVVPLDRAGGRDGRVVPRDARALPLRAAAREVELQRSTRTATPASSSLRTTRTCCFYGSEEAAEGRDRLPRRSARRTSRASRGGRRRRDERRRAPSVVRIWLMAARPKHAAGRARARARRHGARRHGRALRPAALRRRAARRAVHPGRREPLERLLRRAPRCRHGGPPRSRAGDGRRARPAAPGADRDVRDVRAGVALRRLPDRRRRLGAAAGRRRLDPRGRAVHRRSAPLRLRGPRRAVRVPLLRDRRGRRLVLRADRALVVGGVRAGGAGRAVGVRRARRQQRARPRHRQTRRQAHAGGSARARAHARPLCRDGLRRRPAGPGHVALRSARAWMLLPLPGHSRWRAPIVRTVRTRTDGPSLNERARAHRPARARRSACCCAPASC